MGIQKKLLFKELINIAYHSTIENQIGITPNLEKSVKSAINKDYKLEKQGFAKILFDWEIAYRITTITNKINKKNLSNSIMTYVRVFACECKRFLIILLVFFAINVSSSFISSHMPFVSIMKSLPISIFLSFLSYFIIDIFNSFINKRIVVLLPKWVGNSLWEQFKNTIKDIKFIADSSFKIKNNYKIN